MQIELNPQSQAKLEDILDQMATYYDLEELTADELIEALLDVGVDLTVAQEAPVPVSRDRLIEYCAKKVAGRG